jgi:hypothetical protein
MMLSTAGTLAAPFPYFGGKSNACAPAWQAFGRVDNYVEPFAGSAAMLKAEAKTIMRREEAAQPRPQRCKPELGHFGKWLERRAK